ncbi:MAG: hypothetical protein MAG431_02038 [Chloroflexi bacterium]|nr:hypothetical protein [Chloroflexota bacterium]
MLRGRSRIVVLALLVIVLGATVYGFAAANTVEDGGAGDGTGTISGYEITGITYTLDGTDPSKVASVQFDVASTSGNASDPTSVSITVDDGTNWVSCSAGATTTCTFSSQPSVSNMEDLQVVASQ